jgi:hypothetical protein
MIYDVGAGKSRERGQENMEKRKTEAIMMRMPTYHWRGHQK